MDNELLKEVLEAVMMLPAMKWCEDQQRQSEEAAKMSEAEMNAPAMEEHLAEEGGEVPGAEGEAEEEIAEGEEKVAEGEAEEHDGEEEEKAKFSEAEGNGGQEANDDQEDELGESKIKMQYEQEKRRYAKLETELNNLKAKTKQIEQKERIANRKADLMQLEAEGYAFDIAEELDEVKDMELSRYSKHLSKIKKRYSKAPIGFKLDPAIKDETPMVKSHHDILKEANKRAEEKWGVK